MAKTKRSLVTDENTINLGEICAEIYKKPFTQLTENERDILVKVALEKRQILWKKIPCNEAILATQEVSVISAEQMRGAVKSDLEKHTKFLENKHKEYIAAEEELKKAQTRVKKAKDVLIAAKEFHEVLQRKLEKAENDYKEEQKALEEMKVLALVHSSASLKQVKKNQLAKIIVTKSDEVWLTDIIPDGIFVAEKAENFVEVLPRNFEMKYNPDERKNIIDFCNLVINFKLGVTEQQKLVVLFANQDIAEILKLNGLEDF